MFKQICISFILMLIGAMIYIIFRQDVYFLMCFPTELLTKLKIDVDYANCSIGTYFFIFCLPDSLWYASLLTFQSACYERRKITIILLYASIFLPFIYEFLQKIGIIAGTFDIMDLLTYLLTLIIVLLCQRKHFFHLLH